MQIDHLAIWTNRLEQMRHFYVHYFGGASGEKYINPRKNFESYFIGFENGARIELMEKLEIPRCTKYADIGDFCRQQLVRVAEPRFEANQRALANYFIDLGEKPYGDRLREFIDELLPGAAKSA